MGDTVNESSLSMNGSSGVARGRAANWPPVSPDTLYDYCFAVWPDETSPRWNRAAFDLFRMLGTRVVLEFTERGFNDFREDLAKVGLTLREVERAPHLQTVAVL
jgi:hypothetical protein